MPIVQQLQAETAAITATSTTQSVTLGAGLNRLFLVAILSTSALEPLVYYANRPLRRIALGSGSFLRWYVLRESELPPNGANNLVVSYPLSVTFVVGWWILEGCSQGDLRSSATDGFSLTTTTGQTSMTVSLPGIAGDAIFGSAIKRVLNGSLDMLIDGIALTEDISTTMSAAFFAIAGSLLFIQNVVSTLTITFTADSPAQVFLLGIRIGEAPALGTAALLDEESGTAALVMD